MSNYPPGVTDAHPFFNPEPEPEPVILRCVLCDDTVEIPYDPERGEYDWEERAWSYRTPGSDACVCNQCGIDAGEKYDFPAVFTFNCTVSPRDRSGVRRSVLVSVLGRAKDTVVVVTDAWNRAAEHGVVHGVERIHTDNL